MLPIKIDVPKKFLKEEVRDGILIPTQIKEAWAVQLDLLNELMEVCKANNLQVFADSGTLLGAARHKGFIPWDNDLDVMMFRPDYEKLLKIAPKVFKKPYFLQTMYNDKGYAQLHAKLRNTATTGIVNIELGKDVHYNQGIFIDIFVFDYIPEDKPEKNGKRERTTYMNEIEVERKKLYHLLKATVNYSTRHDKFLIGSTFLRSIADNSEKSYDEIVKEQAIKVDELNKKYMNTPTSRIYTQEFFSWKGRRLFFTEQYSKTKYLKFEFLKIPCPYKYDEVLTIWYKDWRTPSMDGALHGNITFDAHQSYKDYLKNNS